MKKKQKKQRHGGESRFQVVYRVSDGREGPDYPDNLVVEVFPAESCIGAAHVFGPIPVAPTRAIGGAYVHPKIHESSFMEFSRFKRVEDVSKSDQSIGSEQVTPGWLLQQRGLFPPGAEYNTPPEIVDLGTQGGSIEY